LPRLDFAAALLCGAQKASNNTSGFSFQSCHTRECRVDAEQSRIAGMYAGGHRISKDVGCLATSAASSEGVYRFV
jgi:hypothetical protein